MVRFIAQDSQRRADKFVSNVIDFDGKTQGLLVSCWRDSNRSINQNFLCLLDPPRIFPLLTIGWSICYNQFLSLVVNPNNKSLQKPFDSIQEVLNYSLLSITTDQSFLIWLSPSCPHWHIPYRLSWESDILLHRIPNPYFINPRLIPLI